MLEKDDVEVGKHPAERVCGTTSSLFLYVAPYIYGSKVDSF